MAEAPRKATAHDISIVVVVVICTVLFLGSAVALAAWGIALSRSGNVDVAAPVVLGSTLALLAGLGIPSVALRERHLRDREAVACEGDCEALEHALGSATESTLRGLILLNYRQM